VKNIVTIVAERVRVSESVTGQRVSLVDEYRVTLQGL
jgi:hypothetical protein